MHDRSSALAQPSLLPNMLNLDGKTPSRVMGTRIYCTDCHNADDNREFGGTGPNGPHGSKWTHLLERRYEFALAPAPGQAITNLYPTPDFSVNGPYAMCGKCHDLVNQVNNNTSWPQHSLAYQRRLQLLGLPHGTRDASGNCQCYRRTAGQFRC